MKENLKIDVSGFLVAGWASFFKGFGVRQGVPPRR